MADKSLVTQVQLTDLKSALAQEADSLIYHSGASLSKAHGFGIIMNGPANDGNGNDLTTYQDSGGNIVGTRMLQVCIAGQNLWMPIKATALSGQGTLTGLQPNLAPLLQPGGNCWVTDFSDAGVADAQLVMSALLLPHTRKAYWEVHGGINAYVYTTYDSAGHIVGDYVIELFFASKKIWIPASSRLGGPCQPPRSAGGYDPTFVHGTGMHGISPPDPDTYCPAWPSGGTLPFKFEAQYWDGAAWQDMLPTYPANTTVYPPSYINSHGNIPIQWSDTDGCIKILGMSKADNNSSYSKFRMWVYSTLCPSVKVWLGDITIQMEELDPGCMFLFRTALNWKLPDYVVYDAKEEFYNPRARRGYKRFCYTAVPLMKKSKLFFWLADNLIVKPFLWWGAFRYRRLNKWGWLFGLYCRAWLLFWNLLGMCVGECAKPPGWQDKELTIVPTGAKLSASPTPECSPGSCSSSAPQ